MRRTVLAVAILLTLLLLAACGRDKEETPTPEPTSPPTATATSTPAPPTATPQAASPLPTPAGEGATESPLPTPESRTAQFSPLPTPGPLAAAPCDQPLSGAEARVAQQFPELGCPLGSPRLIQMARQPFQRGQMIWRGDTRVIYVLQEDGSWLAFADTFEEGMPEIDPSMVPPQGLYQPIRGFGKLWREQLGAEAASVGWATAPEQGVNGSVQEWEGGLLIGFGLQDQLVLRNDGVWARVE